MSDIVNRLRFDFRDRDADEVEEMQQEIDRLRAQLAQRTADLAKANAERDEARRAACKSESRYFDRVQWPPPYKPCEDRILCRAKEIAAERGWDCFKKGNKTC